MATGEASSLASSGYPCSAGAAGDGCALTGMRDEQELALVVGGRRPRCHRGRVVPVPDSVPATGGPPVTVPESAPGVHNGCHPASDREHRTGHGQRRRGGRRTPAAGRKRCGRRRRDRESPRWRGGARPGQLRGLHPQGRRHRGQPGAQSDIRPLVAGAADTGALHRSPGRRSHLPLDRQLPALYAVREPGDVGRHRQAGRPVCTLLPAVPAGLRGPGLPRTVFQRPGDRGDRQPAGDARPGRHDRTRVAAAGSIRRGRTALGAVRIR